MFGQADLAGNMFEWLADSGGKYGPECRDCFLANSAHRAVTGGAFSTSIATLATSYRENHPPTARYDGFGGRCARAP